MDFPKALAGVRVLDFTWVRSGPWGTRWLGTLGAEVIKVEWPPAIQGRPGDYTTPQGITMDLNHRGGFNDTNCNKLATTVNARSEKGLDFVKRLVSVSDIVIENFSYGVLEAWGLGYEEMRKLRPDVIYVSLPGFGHEGRDKLYNTFGPVAQALSGLTYLSGLPGAPPAGWGWSYLDDTGGLYGTICSLTALHHRNMTGKGQHVDGSQMIAGIPMNGAAILDVTVNGRKSRRPGYPPGNRTTWPGTPLLNNYRGRTAVPHNAYRTKGGGPHDWCAIACFSDDEWRSLVDIMGSPEWAGGSDMATLRGRLERQDEVDEGIERWTQTVERYELMERCQAAGIRAMPVQSNGDRVDNDPQLQARGWLNETKHPTLGSTRLQNAPFKMSESPAFNWRYGPLVGEDNREVFEGLLGLAHEELERGYEDGTFWPSSFSMDPYPYAKEIQQAPSVPRAAPLSHLPGSPAGPAPRMNEPEPLGPLAGVRVLDLADETGRFCGRLMADLGADVIKIEPPGGDGTRTVGPFVGDVPHRDRSLSFWHHNTSKRSVTLELEQEEGRSLFRRLASTADVILETLKPGHLPSLGLGYEDLSPSNPGLIMCSLTPFGQTGPWKHYLACDLVQLAAGGQMGCCGYDKEDVPDAPPIAGGGGQSGFTASHYTYIAILAALCYRSMTGKGQYIDASVHESCALTTENMVAAYLYRGEIVYPQTGRHASHGGSSPIQFQTGDGRYVNATRGSAGMRPQALKAMTEWLRGFGLADDLDDPKYGDQAVINENIEHVNDVVGQAINAMSGDDLYHGAQQLGLTWGVIRTPDELLTDGHLHDRGFFAEVEHPELRRTVTYPGSAVIYNGSPWRISRRPPLVGEHNDEVLCGELGLDRAQLSMLAEAGVV